MTTIPSKADIFLLLAILFLVESPPVKQKPMAGHEQRDQLRELLLTAVRAGKAS
jgi:hypothetical protein